MTKKNTSPFKPETIADIVQYCGSEESLLAAFKSLRKTAIESALEGELGPVLRNTQNPLLLQDMILQVQEKRTFSLWLFQSGVKRDYPLYFFPINS